MVSFSRLLFFAHYCKVVWVKLTVTRQFHVSRFKNFLPSINLTECFIFDTFYTQWTDWNQKLLLQCYNNMKLWIIYNNAWWTLACNCNSNTLCLSLPLHMMKVVGVVVVAWVTGERIIQDLMEELKLKLVRLYVSAGQAGRTRSTGSYNANCTTFSRGREDPKLYSIIYSCKLLYFLYKCTIILSFVTRLVLW